mmetsp:Transcript_31116/g.49969  ORF Transcript_31116/g.49969 Transcript_31116/m.49969 type:complete len:223 (-) Transcript_31116:98-766(-)
MFVLAQSLNSSQLILRIISSSAPSSPSTSVSFLDVCPFFLFAADFIIFFASIPRDPALVISSLNSVSCRRHIISYSSSGDIFLLLSVSVRSNKSLSFSSSFPSWITAIPARKAFFVKGGIGFGVCLVTYRPAFVICTTLRGGLLPDITSNILPQSSGGMCEPSTASSNAFCVTRPLELAIRSNPSDNCFQSSSEYLDRASCTGIRGLDPRAPMAQVPWIYVL